MPAAPRDWAEPFLEQASEDLAAAWSVGTAESASTFCMLLQMVFEKLAKGAFARSGQAVPKNHQAATRLFLLLDRHPGGIALLQQHPNVRAFVLELEAAHPSIAGKQQPPWPQLEYPWEDTVTGNVMYPARDLAIVKRVRNPKDRIAQDSLKLASALEKELVRIIP